MAGQSAPLRSLVKLRGEGSQCRGSSSQTSAVPSLSLLLVIKERTGVGPLTLALGKEAGGCLRVPGPPGLPSKRPCVKNQTRLDRTSLWACDFPGSLSTSSRTILTLGYGDGWGKSGSSAYCLPTCRTEVGASQRPLSAAVRSPPSPNPSPRHYSTLPHSRTSAERGNWSPRCLSWRRRLRPSLTTGVRSPNSLGGHRDRGAELSPSPAGVHSGDTSTHTKK